MFCRIFSRRATPLLASVLLVFMCGCSPTTPIEKFADDAKEKTARDYIQRLTDGDVVALSAELSPNLRTPHVQLQLKEMSRLLARETPAVTNLVGYNWHKSGSGGSTYNLSYQFGYESKWVLANVAWYEHPNGQREIIGLSARPTPASLQEINGFSFKKAGTAHYLFLAAIIAVPLFIITTLIVCIRTKITRRKWLWLIFILVGIASVSFNWTTGTTNVSPFSFQLLGFGAVASSVYSPWILSVSLPIGAIVFWLKRRKLAGPVPANPEPPRDVMADL